MDIVKWLKLHMHRAIKKAGTHCIEGEHVTAKEIAERLGVSESSVNTRLRKLRTENGAITWDKLK